MTCGIEESIRFGRVGFFMKLPSVVLIVCAKSMANSMAKYYSCGLEESISFGRVGFFMKLPSVVLDRNASSL